MYQLAVARVLRATTVCQIEFGKRGVVGVRLITKLVQEMRVIHGSASFDPPGSHNKRRQVLPALMRTCHRYPGSLKNWRIQEPYGFQKRKQAEGQRTKGQSLPLPLQS